MLWPGRHACLPDPASSTIVVFHARLSSVHLCSHACCANTQRCGRTLQMRSRGALQVAHEVAHRHAHIPVGIVRNRSGRLERRHRHGLQRPPVGVLAHLQPVLGVFVSQSSVWCLVYGVWRMAHGAFGVWCLAAHLPALHISPGSIAHQIVHQMRKCASDAARIIIRGAKHPPSHIHLILSKGRKQNEQIKNPPVSAALKINLNITTENLK